jgi:arabinan endo-1,5-alpha-L-arabinosidase
MATYTNPVYARDFPDPHVLVYRGKFYAYATHSSGYDFQVMESPDLVHWTHRGSAFCPPWSREHLWAPEVIRHRGVLYMTYSARNPETGKHDIGIATSADPLGPFTHRAILVRGDDNRIGVIDATIFFDKDGTPYLVYSEEDPRAIVLRRMTPDLLRVSEEKTVLLRPDRDWEKGIVEAPTMLYRNRTYYLFYSGGWFQSYKRDACYAVAYATASSLKGPYTKAERILQTVPGKVYSPGHQCIVSLPSGQMWMLYHAWDDQNEPLYGSNPLGRTLRLDRLYWRDGKPYVDGPSTEPRQAPRVR